MSPFPECIGNIAVWSAYRSEKVVGPPIASAR